MQLLALAPQDLDRLDMPQFDAVRYCRNYLLALMQWYSAQDEATPYITPRDRLQPEESPTFKVEY